MSRPPRIPVWLPWHQSVIYFVTICVEDRQPVLANPEAFAAFQRTIQRLDRWILRAAVVMPDHVHLMVIPLDRDTSIKHFSRWLKVWWREDLKAAWKFQDGCFDRLLRKEEFTEDKWFYMRENPVRAGLVKEWHEWPYSINLNPPDGEQLQVVRPQ